MSRGRSCTWHAELSQNFRCTSSIFPSRLLSPPLLSPPTTPRQAANLLCALETVSLLLSRSPQAASLSDDANLRSNQSLLAQAGLMDALLPLSLEGHVSSAAVRTQVT